MKEDVPEPGEPRPDSDVEEGTEEGVDEGADEAHARDRCREDELKPDADVRAGGDAGRAPPSLSAVEARWQDHESSGSSWDDPERM